MNKSSPLIWIAILLIFLLPTAGGRFLLDLAGGLMIALFAIPLLLTGLGWLGWRFLQTKMKTCPTCGVRSFSDSNQCPFCGSGLSNQQKSEDSKSQFESSLPASASIIDVIAKEEGSE